MLRESAEGLSSSTANKPSKERQQPSAGKKGARRLCEQRGNCLAAAMPEEP